MAQQYDPNFNQVPLPAVNPQMAAPVGVDLGIQRVEAEFNRQEAGLRENIAQQKQNMRIATLIISHAKWCRYDAYS